MTCHYTEMFARFIAVGVLFLLAIAADNAWTMEVQANADASVSPQAEALNGSVETETHASARASLPRVAPEPKPRFARA